MVDRHSGGLRDLSGLQFLLVFTGVWATVLFFVGWAALADQRRRSPGEHGLDVWAERRGYEVAERKCDDARPLRDGMVRCDVVFAWAGPATVYCPGELSNELACRWVP